MPCPLLFVICWRNLILSTLKWRGKGEPFTYWPTSHQTLQTVTANILKEKTMVVSSLCSCIIPWLPLQSSQAYRYKSARNLKGKQTAKPNKRGLSYISWLEAKSSRERILVYKHCFDVWNKQYGWQDFFFKKGVCIFLYVYAPHLYYIFKRPEEGTGSPRSEVTDGCELPCVCLVSKAGLSGKVASTLLTIKPSLQSYMTLWHVVLILISTSVLL